MNLKKYSSGPESFEIYTLWGVFVCVYSGGEIAPHTGKKKKKTKK